MPMVFQQLSYAIEIDHLDSVLFKDKYIEYKASDLAKPIMINICLWSNQSLLCRLWMFFSQR